jgi:alpha-1,2-mannosyltransferase
MTFQVALPAARDRGTDLFFKLAFAIGTMVALLEAGYLLSSPLPYDPIGYLVGRDFVNTWVGAQLALTGDPGQFFEPHAYNALLKEHFGADYPLHIWSYPPHFLLLIWPFAFLPYMPAYVLYSALGLILYLWVVSEGRRRADHLVLLLLAPAVMVNIWSGQTGFLVAAFVVGGLIQLDRRPVLAGVLFGLLSIKPQLGILLPLMLLLTRRWRTIAAAAVTIAVLAAATTIAFGPQVWTAYVNDAMPMQTKVVVEGFSHYMVHMPTAFMNAKTAGLSLMAAIWIQTVVSAVTVAAVTWTFWRRRDRELSNALLVTAIFTVTPYAFNYDMVVFGWVILMLMDRSDNEPLDCGLMLGLWAVPFLTVPMGMSGVLSVSSLPIFAFGVRLFWRLWQQARRLDAMASGPIPWAQPKPL